ncbi:MAG TPA: DUF1572 family protein [Mucilaginibacter sp.]|jgi:uncharacterized damage-inducible protein DinB|nr:DUF1572 family protein [Mucilaginibacter sp.]
MLQEILKRLIIRDLEKLKTEIDAYNTEGNIWLVPGGISNSAGNLCLHLVGNLNHYAGTVLGNTGYVRQRDLEFSQKDVPRAELIEKIEETIRMIDTVLDKVSDEQLASEFPVVVFAKGDTTGYFLTHLATHLDYHLGQVNYHRRLLDK